MSKGSTALIATAAAALALCAVIAALRERRETKAPTSAPTAATQDAKLTELQKPESLAESYPPELWSDERSLHFPKLLDVALDSETQWAIYYDACDYVPGLFCLVIAIAGHESEFNPKAEGDNGDSLGIMQINTKWHADRMEDLGVTDLTDPVQCAIVGIDYLWELEDRYGYEPESDAILMAYNMGPNGARKAINEGRTSTAYSREIMTAYRGYLEELGDSKP